MVTQNPSPFDDDDTVSPRPLENLSGKKRPVAYANGSKKIALTVSAHAANNFAKRVKIIRACPCMRARVCVCERTRKHVLPWGTRTAEVPAVRPQSGAATRLPASECPKTRNR